MSSTNDSLTVKSYLDIFFRRKYSIAVIFVLGLLSTITYSALLPPIYRSSTLILVEPQRISSAYVSPTVTTTVQERLSTISQQILSRTNLEKIILQHNLYQNSEPYLAKGIWKRIYKEVNNKIRIIFGEDIYRKIPWIVDRDINYSLPLEVLVDIMRKDIEIKVIGGNNAFTLSYMGEDPILVMKATNTLAALFIEENLKIREQQVEGTSEFLAGEHAEAKKELERQEKLLKEFKERNMGSLPEQMDANLRTLDRLQVEMQTINDMRKNVEGRKIFYEGQISNIEKQPVHTKVGTPTETEPKSITDKINELNSSLKKMQAEFNDNYPDILIIRNQIRELENQITQENTRSDQVQE